MRRSYYRSTLSKNKRRYLIVVINISYPLSIIIIGKIDEKLLFSEVEIM